MRRSTLINRWERDNCRSLQADRAGVVRDTKQANSEGKVQRYTSRAGRYRRVDEEAWQQITTLLLLRGGAHSIEDEDQELAMKKTYREKAQAHFATPSTSGAGTKRGVGSMERLGMSPHDQSRSSLF